MEAAKSNNGHLLTVNAGSSSVKLAVFAANDPSNKMFEASIFNIGQTTSGLVADGQKELIEVKDHEAAIGMLLSWLTTKVSVESIVAVSHRIVHGGPEYYESQVVTAELIHDLKRLTVFDPEHLPVELRTVEMFKEILPHAKQVVCFDTAFHHDLPAVAKLLPIPRHFANEGLRRYGFHGLSYAYILEELRRVEGEAAANGKVIIAHLGSGASLAAVKDGKPIDTTMGTTPTSGIPMSTRTGDIDAGLALYFAERHHYSADKFNHMVSFESGLLGVSETTADMERLLQIEHEDSRAKDAADLFCYHVKKSIGGLSAALGGLNTLVFTGGMGENAPKIRARICEGLEFFGIKLDDSRNKEGARLISADDSAVGVHVIHTDESITMARETAKLT